MFGIWKDEGIVIYQVKPGQQIATGIIKTALCTCADDLEINIFLVKLLWKVEKFTRIFPRKNFKPIRRY